jgi:hypothetical protein
MGMSAIFRKAKTHVHAVIHALSSPRLAVSLLIVLAAVFTVAIGLAIRHGQEYSQWFVYHTWWFTGLLILLTLSISAAAYVRFPWKRHHTGLVLTHAGLLMILIGSLFTLWLGFDGQTVLREGSSTDTLMSGQHSQVTASWVDRPNEPAYVFTFESGPVDWKPGTPLDIGSVDGMSVRVLNYYHCSEAVESWVADGGGRGRPLVRFQLAGPDDHGLVEHFLVDQDYGAEIFVGPIAIRLGRALSDAMLADFLQPPKSEPDEKGTLTIYFEDRVQRASVAQSMGQAIDVGNGRAKVELIHYFTNAKLDASGKFQPVSEDEPNPLVELKVELPGDDRPFRQVAFAKSPLLNFDGVYERDCPVKFVYDHPQVERATAIEMLQSGDGKLYARTIAGGKCQSHGEVKASSRVDLPGGFSFTVTDYVPHARRELSFKSAKRNAGGGSRRDLSAAELQIAIAGATDTLWLQRNHPEMQLGTIVTPDGKLRVQFTSAQIPLGFTLEPIEFQRETSRGGGGIAACSSLVRVVDSGHRVDDQCLITMTEPITHNGFRFYQTRLDDGGHGKRTSILRVVYDPTRGLKKAGVLIVCLGIATMFCMRSSARSSVATD